MQYPVMERLQSHKAKITKLTYLSSHIITHLVLFLFFEIKTTKINTVSNQLQFQAETQESFLREMISQLHMPSCLLSHTRDKEGTLIHWFILQMLPKTETGSKPGAGSPIQVSSVSGRNQILESPLLFPIVCISKKLQSESRVKFRYSNAVHTAVLAGILTTGPSKHLPVLSCLFLFCSVTVCCCVSWFWA